MIHWVRWSSETWEMLRRRMLGETERFLEGALSRRRSVPRIPRVRVGAGRFRPDYAARFWHLVLFESSE